MLSLSLNAKFFTLRHLPILLPHLLPISLKTSLVFPQLPQSLTSGLKYHFWSHPPLHFASLPRLPIGLGSKLCEVVYFTTEVMTHERTQGEVTQQKLGVVLERLQLIGVTNHWTSPSGSTSLIFHFFFLFWEFLIGGLYVLKSHLGSIPKWILQYFFSPADFPCSVSVFSL